MKRPTDAFWIELMKLDQQLDASSYYDLLGVASDVSIDDLRSSYERQIRVLHPDRHSREANPERKAALTRVYARVGEAFRVLSHPQHRQDYDSGLRGGKKRFLDSRTDHGPGALADPKHPMAKSLHVQALALISGNDKKGARSKLQLAKQYEPDSKAIADALAECEAPKPSAPLPPPPASLPLATPPPPLPLPPPPIAEPLSTTASATSQEEAEFEGPPSRVHARIPMGQAIRISCKKWEQIQTFYMHNISRGGMLLRCHEQLPVGSVMELSIITPDGESIQLPAEVVRHVAPKKAGQRPGVGVRFLVIPDPVRSRFEDLLRLAGLGPAPEPIPAVPAKDQEQEAGETAEALIQSGDYRGACQALQQPIREFPDNKQLRASFHLAAGLMARERSQDAAAHSHFERALRFDPDSQLILRALRENSL